MSSDVKRLGDRIWNIGRTWLYGPFREREFREAMLPFLVYQRWWRDEGAPHQALATCDSVEDLLQRVRESPITDLLLRLNIEPQARRINKTQRLSDFLCAIAQLQIGSFEERFSIGELYQYFLSKNSKVAKSDGAFYTPPDVARLMAKLLFANNAPPESYVQIYDPACGMGDLLLAAADVCSEMYCTRDLKIQLLGQELDPFTHAICQAEMWLQGAAVEDIKQGDTLAIDRFPFLRPRYILANPPFGTNWSSAKPFVQREIAQHGERSRWAEGISRINDPQLMFLQHIAKKLHPNGGRAVVLTNGSPLYVGEAGGGESNIRLWMGLKAGIIDSIISLPENLFYNTAIATYLWVLDTNKSPARRGKTMLINGAEVINSHAT